MYEHVCEGTYEGQKKISDALKLGLLEIVSLSMQL